MQQEGVQPGSVTFVGVLKACASMVAIEEGRCVH
jgi:pentatricopeptide repeat protein